METSPSDCSTSVNQLNDQLIQDDYLDTLIAAVTSSKQNNEKEEDTFTEVQNSTDCEVEKPEKSLNVKEGEEEQIDEIYLSSSLVQPREQPRQEHFEKEEEQTEELATSVTSNRKKKRKYKRKRIKKVNEDEEESENDSVESKKVKTDEKDSNEDLERNESNSTSTMKDRVKNKNIKKEIVSSSGDDASTDDSSSSSSDSDGSSSLNSGSDEDDDSSESSGDDDDDDQEEEDKNEKDDTKKEVKVKAKIKKKNYSNSKKKRKDAGSDSDENGEKSKGSSRKRRLMLKRQRKKEKEMSKRRNIRSILREDQLEAETVAAQNEEIERQRRLQELKKQMQQKVVKPEEKDSQLKSLLQGDCSSAAFFLGSEQLGAEDTTKRYAKDDVILLDSGDDNKKKVLTDIIELSDDDDVVMIKSDEEPEEEEEEEDLDNVGTHINDDLNQPDDIGNVLINIGHPDGDPDVYLASQITEVIKPHQIGGVRFLYDNVIESQSRFKSSGGFGCILAHSMGLGKTIQLIGFIDIFLRFTEARSALCIVPINTIQNWLAEFNMWLPEKPLESPENGEVDEKVTLRDFKLFVINDNHKTTLARAKILDEWSRVGGVLLMGYEMYRLLVTKKCTFGPPSRRRKKNNQPIVIDIEEEDMNKKLHLGIQKALVNPGPDLIVCDEGHRIKNSLSGVAQSLKNIKTKRRIVLTGYPLQNNLLEYWCMVDFVRPNYLGTKAEFCNMFERPIMNGQCVDSTREDVTLMRYRAHVLHSLLQGFIQRRGHSVLRFSLPPKQEHVFNVRMSSIQRQLYNKFMDCISDCEMGMWASYNPLKAFSTCCKIWNHPDVMWKVIQHQKNLAEDNDLDFEPDGKVNGVQSGGKKKSKSVAGRSCINTSTNKRSQLLSEGNTANTARKNTMKCSSINMNISNNTGISSCARGSGVNNCSGVGDNTCSRSSLSKGMEICCSSGINTCGGPGIGQSLNSCSNSGTRSVMVSNNNSIVSGMNTGNNTNLDQGMGLINTRISNCCNPMVNTSRNAGIHMGGSSCISTSGHMSGNGGVNTISHICSGSSMIADSHVHDSNSTNCDMSGSHMNSETGINASCHMGGLLGNINASDCISSNSDLNQGGCINSNDSMIIGSHIGMNTDVDRNTASHMVENGSMNIDSHMGLNAVSHVGSNDSITSVSHMGNLNTSNNLDANSSMNTGGHLGVNNGINTNGHMSHNSSMNSGSHMGSNSGMNIGNMNTGSNSRMNPSCHIGDSNSINTASCMGSMNLGSHMSGVNPGANISGFNSGSHNVMNTGGNIGHGCIGGMNTINHISNNGNMNSVGNIGGCHDMNSSCHSVSDAVKNMSMNTCGQMQDNVERNSTCHISNNIDMDLGQIGSNNGSNMSSNIGLSTGNLMVGNTNMNTCQTIDNCTRNISCHINSNTSINTGSSSASDNSCNMNSCSGGGNSINISNNAGSQMNMNTCNANNYSSSNTNVHMCSQTGTTQGTQAGVPPIVPTDKKTDASVLSLEWVEELMKEYTPGVLENGGKMVLLFSLIEESLKNDDKLLLFSQSLTTLNVIEDFLSKYQVPRPEIKENWCKNKNYFRLDGSTPAAEREKLINQFNSLDNNRVWLFLLSTRAGCLGINLIGANRVVIFDASWNPCHDCQAVCRVYRYGQVKKSYIYRLITDNTLEKKIYDRQINKQGMSDRVVDELNPENQFTRQQVDSLLHYVDQDLPECQMEGLDNCTDTVMKSVLKKHGKWLTKEPFSHESLLLDQKNLRLTKKEKNLAKQGYVMEKKMNLSYSRQSYAMYYPKPGQPAYYQGPGPWPNNFQPGDRPVASVKPMISTPVPMTLPQVNFPLNQMLRSTMPGQQVKVVRPGVSVHQIITTTDIMLPGSNNNSSYPDVISAGQQIHVIKTPRGVYIRTNKGKIFAVRSKPPTTTTTTNQTTASTVPDLLLPPTMSVTTSTTGTSNSSNISVNSTNSGPGNSAAAKSPIAFLDNRSGNQITCSNNNDSNSSTTYPDYLNYLRSLKPQFQSGYLPQLLTSGNGSSSGESSNFNNHMLPQHMIQSSPTQQQPHFQIGSQGSDSNKSTSFSSSSSHQLISQPLSVQPTPLQKQLSLQKDNDIYIISDDECKVDSEPDIISGTSNSTVKSNSTADRSSSDVKSSDTSSLMHSSSALELPALIDNIPLQTNNSTAAINVSSQSPFNISSLGNSSPSMSQILQTGSHDGNNHTVSPQQTGSVNDFSTHSLPSTFSSIQQSQNHLPQPLHQQQLQVQPVPVSSSGFSSSGTNMDVSPPNFSSSLSNIQQQNMYNMPSYNYGYMLPPHMQMTKKTGPSSNGNSGYHSLSNNSPSVMNQVPINNINPDKTNPGTNATMGNNDPSLPLPQVLSSSSLL